MMFSLLYKSAALQRKRKAIHSANLITSNILQLYPLSSTPFPIPRRFIHDNTFNDFGIKLPPNVLDRAALRRKLDETFVTSRDCNNPERLLHAKQDLVPQKALHDIKTPKWERQEEITEWRRRYQDWKVKYDEHKKRLRQVKWIAFTKRWRVDTKWGKFKFLTKITSLLYASWLTYHIFFVPTHPLYHQQWLWQREKKKKHDSAIEFVSGKKTKWKYSYTEEDVQQRNPYQKYQPRELDPDKRHRFR